MELKPCPFCGGSPKLIHAFDHNLFAIRHTCLSFGRPILMIDSILFTTKDDAIKAWNRRASEENESDV